MRSRHFVKTDQWSIYWIKNWLTYVFPPLPTFSPFFSHTQPHLFHPSIIHSSFPHPLPPFTTSCHSSRIRRWRRRWSPSASWSNVHGGLSVLDSGFLLVLSGSSSPGFPRRRNDLEFRGFQHGAESFASRRQPERTIHERKTTQNGCLRCQGKVAQNEGIFISFGDVIIIC